MYLNEVWREITGRTWDQDKGFGWAEAIHPDDLARVTKAYNQAWEEKIPFAVEYRLRRLDGLYIWIRGQGSPSFGPNDELLGYVGSAFKIRKPDQMLTNTPESDEIATIEAMLKEHSILGAIIHRRSLENRAHGMGIHLITRPDPEAA